MAEPQTASNTEEQSVYDKLTGVQKSAILMMLLGEDEASEILKNLSPKEVQNLGTAMYSVQGLDQDTVNRVLDEFLEIIKQQTSLGLGAGNYIRNVLNRALGEDKAQSVLSRISPSSTDRPIEILDWMDARAITEHEPVSVRVPGTRGPLRVVVACGQGTCGSEAANTHRGGGHLGATNQHRVDIACGNHPCAEANVMGAGRAGGDHCKVGAPEVIKNRQIPGDHVDDGARHKKR